jgi:hypothetical protein
MVTQTQILNTLTYLMGERTVPSTALEGRKDFIQRSLEEVYRAYPWAFAGTKTDLTLVDGVATLPSNFDDQHKIYAYFYSGDNQYQVEEVNIGDNDMYEDGSHKFWLETDNLGTYTIHTKDTGYTDITVKYQKVAPTLSDSIDTPFNDRLTIALGAKRYVKMGQNPDADVSQDEALFQKRLNENIAASQVNRPLRKHRAVYKANGYHLGE